MTANVDKADAVDLFSEGGEIGDRLQKVNWSKTAFGPVTQWSQILKTTVKICMDASLPMAVWWRVDTANPQASIEMIFNDTYHLNFGTLSQLSETALPAISSEKVDTRSAVQSVLLTGKTVRREYQWDASNASDCGFSFCYSPLVDEAGTVCGVFASAVETTDRQKAEAVQNRMQAERLYCETAIEQTAQAAQQKITNVLESISDAFIALDRNWCYTYVNQKTAQLLHQDSESLMGQLVWKESFPGKAGTLSYQELYRAMRDNVPVVFEDYSPSFDSWFEVHAYPSAEGLSVYFQDVSDRKKAEAAKEKRLAEEKAGREAAEAASRLKDEFLAVVSHELRSPLNPILGCAELLKKADLPPERKERALDSIERNARIQAQLINDLLDVSQILQGELALNKCSVPVASAVQSTVKSLEQAANDKDISITTEFSPPTSSVVADPGRLHQILWNLISNAIKFTPRSGRITVRIEQNNDQVQFSVTDTGKGICSSFLPHVFDRFRQEDGAKTRQFGGLGLGLSIVRHLVEMHEGTVEASSPGENQGATFTFFLPLGDSPEKNIKNGKRKQALNQTSSGSIAYNSAGYVSTGLPPTKR